MLHMPIFYDMYNEETLGMDAVEFAEKYLGIQLFEYQKQMLRKMSSKSQQLYFYPARGFNYLSWLRYICQKLQEEDTNE